MSILSTLFGGVNANPVQQQQANPGAQMVPKTPGNLPANPTVQVDPNNPIAPAQNNNTGNIENKTQSPLDQFGDLWKNDPNAKAPETTSLFAGLDPAKIHAAAANNDFTKIITPEMQAVLAKGGPEAIAVNLQIMNMMSQKSFGDSAITTTKIVEQALEKQQQKFMEMLPNIIKQQNVSENLRSSNPLFANPAVAPMLEMMKNQVALKHPTLSASEQVKMAQDYVIAFAQAANPVQQTQAQKLAAGDTDWNVFLNS